MGLDLYPHQIEVLPKIKNGCILNGTVGSGKSRTALAYYYLKVIGGKLKVNGVGRFEEPTNPRPLVIITTAKKRDSLEWEQEMQPFMLSTDKELSVKHIPVTVDSWNNIQKYKNVIGAFFIFDEDRVTGKGAWVKAFLRISQRNKWIILSGTPGDTWIDYVPVFVANHFYKNKTEFNKMHVIFNPYVSFPKVDRYINEGVLMKHKSDILVEMKDQRHTVHRDQYIRTNYDMMKYKHIVDDRWDPYADEPVENISKVCYLMRRVCNDDDSRKAEMKRLTYIHKRIIVFYNYDYELEALHTIAEERGLNYAEWNGHHHQDIPDTDTWLYFVQYNAGAEGWNCVKTNVMVFYSLNYSYKNMVQAKGRIDRINTPYTDLYFYFLTTDSSIDKGIQRALKNKKKFNERRFFGEFSGNSRPSKLCG